MCILVLAASIALATPVAIGAVLRLDRLAFVSFPAAAALNEGGLLYDTTTNTARVSNGTSWIQLGFGSDYQTAVEIARTTTTSATFQTKIALTTGALTGPHRISWTAVADNTALGEFRLQNVTDATTVGAVRIFRGSAGERQDQHGFARVVFTGAAKTFEIQFRDQAGGNTQGIRDARIEIWRIR